MPSQTLPHLVLMRFSALGDVASAARIAAEARRQWPGRRITVVTHARYVPVLEHLAESVEVYGFGTEGRGLWSLVWQLHAWRAEVVDLHRSLRSRLLRLLTPTLSWRVLSKDRKARRALTSGVPTALAQDYRVQVAQAELARVALTAQPWLVAQPSNEGAVVLVPGAAWPEKRWPLASFADVARRLSSQHRVLVLLSSGDGLAVDEHDWGGAELAPDWSLPDCISALAGAGVVLSNDTGFAHLAEALGVPVRVLIGPTDPRLGAAPQSDFAQAQALSLGLPCQPCSQKGDRPCHVGGRPCLQDLGANEVAQQLREAHAKR
jgi:ADP-heptose:LPS heptosyltransferase